MGVHTGRCPMMSERVRSALLAGEVLRGRFSIAGTGVDAPGTLVWSFDAGAVVDLIGDTSDWSADFSLELTLHGSIEDGNRVTIHYARVPSISAHQRVRRLIGSTVALGMYVDDSARWSRAIYSTANLSEWIPETGLTPKFQDEE